MSESTPVNVHKNYNDDLFLYKVSGVLRKMKYSNGEMKEMSNEGFYGLYFHLLFLRPTTPNIQWVQGLFPRG
jgi:hypothetical protein